MMTEFEAEVVCICGGFCTKCPYSKGETRNTPVISLNVCNMATGEAAELRDNGIIPKSETNHYFWLIAESFFTYAEGEI